MYAELNWRCMLNYSYYFTKNYIYTSFSISSEEFPQSYWEAVSWGISSVRSVAQSCPTLCDPMNCSTPGLPVHHQLPEFTQTHLHRVSDAIQPSHPLSSPSPPAPKPSQLQSLFQWVNSLHEVAKYYKNSQKHAFPRKSSAIFLYWLVYTIIFSTTVPPSHICSE